MFAANSLVLNLGKMNIMKFMTKNSSHSTLHIGYKEKYIKETMNIKFLGLEIDNHINWKKHIVKLIPKFSGACYSIRWMGHISNINTLKSVYYAYFHSITKYRKIFLEDDSSNSGKIYKSKLSGLWLVPNPEPLVQVYLNNQRFYLFHTSIYFH
jgi:hypothetical protein